MLDDQKIGNKPSYHCLISVIVKFNDARLVGQWNLSKWLRIFVIIFDFQNMFLRCDWKLFLCGKNYAMTSTKWSPINCKIHWKVVVQRNQILFKVNKTVTQPSIAPRNWCIFSHWFFLCAKFISEGQTRIEQGIIERFIFKSVKCFHSSATTYAS